MAVDEAVSRNEAASRNEAVSRNEPVSRNEAVSRVLFWPCTISMLLICLYYYICFPFLLFAFGLC